MSDVSGRFDGLLVAWPSDRKLANFPWPALDLQLTDHHLCGQTVSQPDQLSLSSFLGLFMSSKLQLDISNYNQWRRRLVNAYEVETGMVLFAGKTV